MSGFSLDLRRSTRGRAGALPPAALDFQQFEGTGLSFFHVVRMRRRKDQLGLDDRRLRTDVHVGGFQDRQVHGNGGFRLIRFRLLPRRRATALQHEPEEERYGPAVPASLSHVATSPAPALFPATIIFPNIALITAGRGTGATLPASGTGPGWAIFPRELQGVLPGPDLPRERRLPHREERFLPLRPLGEIHLY